MIPEILEHRADLEGLCRRFGVKRLDVFGSASTGAFRDDGSDLDFLVDFDPAPIVAGYADRYFGLLESLELLFGRPVDLVVSAAIKNPYFRESLNKTKAAVFAT